MDDLKNISYSVINYCAVCGNTITSPTLIFPKLPLTEMYTKRKPKEKEGRIDQEFLYCEVCGHGQLKHIIPKEILYTKSKYFLRTSESGTAKGANDYFADFIKRTIGKKNFGSILEFGCSDLYLLNLLKDRADLIIGIDPILSGTEKKLSDRKTKVIGTFIEDADLRSVYTKKGNLILSSHTLEHIMDPVKTLHHLFEYATPKDLFIFQFPSLEPLIADYKFDQIFHQHVHYFTLASFSNLIKKLGGEILSHEVNQYHWGALMVAFRKRHLKRSLHAPPAGGLIGMTESRIPFTAKDIITRYKTFKDQMNYVREYIQSFKYEKVMGFGASLMLPVLGYHLGTDFSEFECILDDDRSKDGLYYINLPVRIRQIKKNEVFSDTNMVITASNTPRSVLPRVLSLQPKRIIFTRNVN